ncbi:hypothetical protein SAMN05216214_101215 [Atopomonas hussainii]|uniref:Uncharacterized protein n=1 Tax=Atopomonas hussainii TaxID=1429083 RepID=A0A1H7FG58_9GAMM|nr:hypothetical protein [Atopomonas hussainii]SEK24978.1 hypothetical protein SAMN05216214_101215 [Atopomonas hussainii]
MENPIEIMAACGALIGITMLFVGHVFIMTSAFAKHIAWGLSILLFAPASIIFSIAHWDYANYGAKLFLKGLAVSIACGLIFSYTTGTQ